jgi:hypothetical protein
MKTKEQIQAYNKEYFSRPEVIARAKVRNAQPHIKARRQAYKKTEQGKEAEKRSKVKNWDKRLLRLQINRLKSRYGITPEDYDQMLKEQNGVCAICKVRKKEKLHIDHDHKTGRVRGLLCGACNRALGLLKDNTDFLNKAIEYLQ